jgi:hypothetical protein
MDSTRAFLKTLGNRLWLTFANSGYIIKINPTAMGIFVFPLLKESIRI